MQRIFYFHVAVGVGGLRLLLRRRGRERGLSLEGLGARPIGSRSPSAEVGVLFCTLVLVTGPIWARPIWGVWWTWDPRLTMTVILWAIYARYLMLRAFGGDDEAIARYAAVLGIVGVLDIPVIRVSVRLLQGIHPAVLTTRDGGSGPHRSDDALDAVRGVARHAAAGRLAGRAARAARARLERET